jgi:hypothetical protein
MQIIAILLVLEFVLFLVELVLLLVIVVYVDCLFEGVSVPEKKFAHIELQHFQHR